MFSPIYLAFVLSFSLRVLGLQQHVELKSSGSPEVKRLPTVDAVLEKASRSEGNFTEQASIMYKHVESRQKSIKQAMVLEKAEYEANLSALHDANFNLESEINSTHDKLHSVRKANTDIRNDIEGAQREISLLRSTLGALRPKFGLAKEFVVETLKVTDNEHASELKVLEPPKPHATLARLLHMDGDLDLERSSFLQVVYSPEDLKDKKDKDAPPMKLGMLDGLVSMVSESLKELVGAGAEGRAELKAQFLRRYEEGMHRQEELNEELSSQKEQLDKAATLQKELNVARDKVLNTRKDLDDRLLGLRHFVRQVDRTVDTATKMVESAEQQVTNSQDAHDAEVNQKQAEKEAKTAGENGDAKAAEASRNCVEWCDGHEAAWSDKCSFNGCNGCHNCAEVARSCLEWCDSHDASWSDKCGFNACHGCQKCKQDVKPVQLIIKPAVQSGSKKSHSDEHKEQKLEKEQKVERKERPPIHAGALTVMKAKTGANQSVAVRSTVIKREATNVNKTWAHKAQQSRETKSAATHRSNATAVQRNDRKSTSTEDNKKSWFKWR